MIRRLLTGVSLCFEVVEASMEFMALGWATGQVTFHHGPCENWIGPVVLSAAPSELRRDLVWVESPVTGFRVHLNMRSW